MSENEERTDATWMLRALELAERGRGLVAPNPPVGAVVVRDDRAIGDGFHRGPGTAHAEVVALGEAAVAARGATLYTTLEPCAHFGRTPPCTNAIIDAGIVRVVAALRDPHDIVDGRGFAQLRDAGLEVTEGVCTAAAARQLQGYIAQVRTGLPFVVLKMAATLDGKVAARDGSSRWITGEDARADAHRLRAESDAILVGSGTALADDPKLTVRDAVRTGTPPLRVLADTRGRVEPGGETGGHLFDGDAPTLVATTERSTAAVHEAWRNAGAEVLLLPEGNGGSVSVRALVEALGKRDVQQLLIEGGPTLAWSAVREDVVDRLVLYLAPKLLGGVGAAGMLGGAGFAPLGAAAELDVLDVRTVGRDLRVEADVHRHR
ncbi:MAG TPA: bifunctional diaminohydroxyphosphoribosylaminopyrimidine deaminase/5-amino-6-(5-phosphoribosylamino)uracil reductase RibD [Actinomycetota bacterium]